MQKLRSVFKIFLIVLFTIILIVIAMLYTLVQSTANNTNLTYLPKETVFAARINTGELLKETITAIIQSKDKKFVEELKKMLPLDEENKSGIDYTSNVYYFVIRKDNQMVEGMLYNLRNKEEFDNYFADEKSVVTASNDEVSVLLFNNDPIKDSSKLGALAREIISKATNTSKQISFNENKGVLISTWSQKSVSTDILYNTSIDLSIVDNAFVIEGSISPEKIEFTQNTSTLTPDGFHLSTSMIPQYINDSVGNFFQQHGIKSIPAVKSFSLNYKGVSIDQSEGLRIIPDFECLLTFTDTLSSYNFSNDLIEHEILNKTDSLHYSFRDVEFRIDQFDSASIYISNHASLPRAENKKSIFALQGTPDQLFEIRGNSMYGKIIQILPLYSASKNFANEIEKMDLQFIPNGKNIEVRGEMKFKEGSIAIIEVMHFLSSSSLMK